MKRSESASLRRRRKREEEEEDLMEEEVMKGEREVVEVEVEDGEAMIICPSDWTTCWEA